MSSEEMSSSTPTSISDLTPKMELKGTVKRIELFGAFVDVGIGQDVLLHISQLGQLHVRNVSDVVKEGDEITVYVLKVDVANSRAAVSLLKPPDMTWDDLHVGQMLQGTVVRIENFGAFVDVGAERPALIHVSNLADNYVDSPGDVVQVGQIVEARVIEVDRRNRRIDMSMKSAAEPPPPMPVETEESHMPTAMELALREAMDDERGRRSRKENRDRDRRERRMREQEDIISRTLRSQQR